MALEKAGPSSKTAPVGSTLGGVGRPIGLRQELEQASEAEKAQPASRTAFGASMTENATSSRSLGSAPSRHRNTEYSTKSPRTVEVNTTTSSMKLTDNVPKRSTKLNQPGNKRGSAGKEADPAEQLEPSAAAAEAIQHNDRVMLGNLLRNQYVSLNTTLIGDHTLIAWAAEQCKPEMCRVLLESSADVEAADAGGRTALALGAGAGDVQVCELLLDHQAAVWTKDHQGHVPLHWAAYGGSHEACSLLLTSKAMPNEVDAAGQTPLHTASRFGHSEVCELLLRQKADVNAIDQDGQAPLHLATLWGFPHICALLLESGADRNLQRKDGAAATHLAKLPWI